MEQQIRVAMPEDACAERSTVEIGLIDTGPVYA
jgi:hypothetical protein